MKLLSKLEFKYFCGWLVRLVGIFFYPLCSRYGEFVKFISRIIYWRIAYFLKFLKNCIVFASFIQKYQRLLKLSPTWLIEWNRGILIRGAPPPKKKKKIRKFGHNMSKLGLPYVPRTSTLFSTLPTYPKGWYNLVECYQGHLWIKKIHRAD